MTPHELPERLAVIETRLPDVPPQCAATPCARVYCLSLSLATFGPFSEVIGR